MQIVESKLNMILEGNPHPIHVLNINISCALLRKYFYINYLKPVFLLENSLLT